MFVVRFTNSVDTFNIPDNKPPRSSRGHRLSHQLWPAEVEARSRKVTSNPRDHSGFWVQSEGLHCRGSTIHIDVKIQSFFTHRYAAGWCSKGPGHNQKVSYDIITFSSLGQSPDVEIRQRRRETSRIFTHVQRDSAWLNNDWISWNGELFPNLPVSWWRRCCEQRLSLLTFSNQ